MGDRDEILVQFMAMIGDDVSPEAAAEILSMHDWSLDLALSSIFDDHNRMRRSSATANLLDANNVFTSNQRRESFIDIESDDHVNDIPELANVEDVDEFSLHRSIQDREYSESLRIDRAREKDIQKTTDMIPDSFTQPEPPLGAPNRIQLLLRLPDGKRISRAFLSSDTLQIVINFAKVSSKLDTILRLVSPAPRKMFGDLTLSLAQAGIENQSILVLEKIEYFLFVC